MSMPGKKVLEAKGTVKEVTRRDAMVLLLWTSDGAGLKARAEALYTEALYS